MSAAAAAASTLGVMPLATSSRVAEIRALRVRPFWPARPCDSYGTDTRLMVLSFRHGTSVPYTAATDTIRRRKVASTSTARPVVRQDGEGERLWFYGGGVHTWKAT